MSEKKEPSAEGQVYWSSIEFKTTRDHHQYPEIKGGYVFVFFYTFDVRTFTDAILKDFKENHLEMVKMEFVNPYDTSHEWESKEDAAHFKKLYKEAESTKELVFDDMEAYEEEN